MKIIKNKENLFSIIKNSNNLIISSDGSGTEKLNLIDLYSNSNKPLFITHDPSGNLFEMYNDILEEKGYKVECFNSGETLKSISYNPLKLIDELYNNKNFDEAYELTKKLTYAIYFDPLEKDKFWQLSSMALVNSVILAMISNSDVLLSLNDVIEFIENLGVLEDKNIKNKLDQYFENTLIGRLEYKKISQLGIDTKKEMLFYAINKLKKFNIISDITSNNTIELENICFGDKPVAIFLTTPKFEELSNIFINQVYYILKKENLLPESVGYKREIIFNLDEFSNIPPIERINNIIPLCLAKGIKFNIVIKSLPKLEKIYGENFQTILNNCGNLIYISSDDDKTNSYVSGGLDLDLNSFRENNEMIILSHINRCIFRCKLA
ncbi:hypothetical protein CYK65_15510 [Clostridium perfringens]|uniref:type IV secretory system conjugative DNA transfer family protein n=1 Tax=Clostridium perfringens TaxID=1502 RepID=UPI000D71C93F|nr:type IV secretory system conjugative DNA transfer family protein [Clostridium perfringens]PWX16688.1 hypothetical protein CYK65_15510 [Clostridium perfringens]